MPGVELCFARQDPRTQRLAAALTGAGVQVYQVPSDRDAACAADAVFRLAGRTALVLVRARLERRQRLKQPALINATSCALLRFT